MEKWFMENFGMIERFFNCATAIMVVYCVILFICK